MATTAIVEACEPFGVRKLAREAGLPASVVSNFLRGKGRASADTLAKLSTAAPRLAIAESKERVRLHSILERIRQLAEVDGVSEVARKADVDCSNMRAILAGRRKPGSKLLNRLERTAEHGGGGTIANN